MKKIYRYLLFTAALILTLISALLWMVFGVGMINYHNFTTMRFIVVEVLLLTTSIGFLFCGHYIIYKFWRWK